MKTSNNCRLVVVLILYFSSLEPLYTQNIENLSQQKPVSLSGNIDLRGIYYSANGISPRYPSTSYVLSGAPTLNLYGLAIPFAFTFSNQESKIAQPFAQFGLSPTYKWLTLHGGYRNVSFNQFTLGGHTMLGWHRANTWQIPNGIHVWSAQQSYQIGLHYPIVSACGIR
jgi:hypothetical protein